MWCSACDEGPALPIDDVTPLKLADVREQITQHSLEIDSATTIVVDRAALADTALLIDVAAHAAEDHARLILLDGDDHSWPLTPSGPLLRLLHRDLPWSVTLSVDAATPARRAAQPDLDGALEQARRWSPELLPPDVTTSVMERARLRRQHEASDRVATNIYRLTETHSPGKATGLDR